MGVIEIDPVQLLEDGLRSGVARRIAGALSTHLHFAAHRGPPLAVGSRKADGAPPSLRSMFGGGGGAEELPGRYNIMNESHEKDYTVHDSEAAAALDVLRRRRRLGAA